MIKIYIFIIIVIYLLYSFSEWTLHKYYMHDSRFNFSKYHRLHHKLTDQDMNIKYNKNLGKTQNLCLDEYGIYPALIAMPIYFSVLYFFTKEKKYFIFSLIIFILFTFISIFLWNSIHSYIHGKDASKICKFPSLNISNVRKIKENSYIKWVIKNHVLHHKEKGNYNIIFPGADFILGTYNTSG